MMGKQRVSVHSYLFQANFHSKYGQDRTIWVLEYPVCVRVYVRGKRYLSDRAQS